jgi:hypothetical protein
MSALRRRDKKNGDEQASGRERKELAWPDDDQPGEKVVRVQQRKFGNPDDVSEFEWKQEGQNRQGDTNAPHRNPPPFGDAVPSGMFGFVVVFRHGLRRSGLSAF